MAFKVRGLTITNDSGTQDQINMTNSAGTLAIDSGFSVAGAFTFGDAAADTLTMFEDAKIQFRDTGLYVYSSANGQLDVVADVVCKVTAPTIELEASTAITLDGDVTVDGAHTFTFGTGAIGVNGDATLAAAKKFYVRDTGLYLYSSADGQLDAIADTVFKITAPTATIQSATKINLDGATDLSGALVLDTAATTGITLNAVAMTTGISIAATGLTDAIVISGTTPVDGLHISSACSGAAINISGTNTGRALRIGTKESASTSLQIKSGASIDAEPAQNYLFGLFTKVSADESAATDELRSAWMRTRVNEGCHVGTGAGYGFGVCGSEIQLKVYADAAATNMYSWQNSAVWAQLETQGAAGVNFKSGSHSQCVLANVGLTSTTTIDSGAVVAGITINTNTATSNVTATGGFYGLHITDITPTHLDFQVGVKIDDDCCTTGMSVGNVTTGFLLSGTATTGISITGAETTGISIAPSAATTCALLIGTGVSAGMPMTGTKNGLIRAFGEIQVDEVLAGDIRGIWGRVRQNAGIAVSGGYQVNGVQGSVKMYGGTGSTTALWNHSGLYGSFETDGVSAASVSSDGHISGVTACFGAQANFTIDSGAYAAALMVLNNAGAITATGSFAGVHVKRALSVVPTVFTDGVKVDANVATTCFTTSGTSASASGRVLKGQMTVNNANYGDGYALMESELTLTGTSTGHTAALSSWVNIGSGVATNFVCAQTNGVWEDGATISGATVIFGMRMQSLCSQAPGESYPFSCVSNTNIITAIFQCNDASSDLGRITNAGADAGTLIPLYKDNSGVKYVKIYTAV